MRRLLGLLLAGLALGGNVWGQDFRHAVVRITSHGISGTVIYSRQDYSLILSCAHGFVEGGDRTRTPVVVDLPSLDGRELPAAKGKPYLVALDAEKDLSLIVLPAGPLATCPLCDCPTCRPGQCVSCGYDLMRSLPGPLVAPATVAGSDPGYWLTREPMGQGRSGGPLIDVERGQVVGIVQGVQVAPRTSTPGMYVASAIIVPWVARNAPGVVSQPAQGGSAPSPQYATPSPYVPVSAPPKPQPAFGGIFNVPSQGACPLTPGGS